MAKGKTPSFIIDVELKGKNRDFYMIEKRSCLAKRKNWYLLSVGKWIPLKGKTTILVGDSILNSGIKLKVKKAAGCAA